MIRNLLLTSLLVLTSTVPTQVPRNISETLDFQKLSKSESQQRGSFILFHKETTQAQRTRLIQELNLKKFSKFSTDYFDRLYYSEANTFNSKVRSVAKILPNQRMKLALATIKEDETNDFSSHDELSGFQYGHYYNGQKYFYEEFDDLISEKEITSHASINASPILGKIKNEFKRDVIVAVLDTGVDITHPDINFYAGEDCNADGGVPIVNPVDRDGNGKAGDCRGWDFTKKSGRLNLPDDDARNGHGTHISGIISAVSGNGGLAGLSNRIKILPVKVIKRNENLVGAAVSFTETVALAIEYAIEKNVDVINMSYGWASTVDSEVIREMIKLANQKGIFVVAAAGNDSNNLDFYPCNHTGVVCVGSTSPFKSKSAGLTPKISDFSNYGGVVDVFAPGDGILSTYPRSLDSTDKIFDQRGYEYGYGTSQAAPFISLAFAVSLGLETSEHLSLSANPIRELKSRIARLKNSSKQIDDPKKWGSAGSLDLAAFVNGHNDNFVAPKLKNIPVIKVEGGLQFEFDLAIENLSAQATSNISINVSSQSHELILNQQNFKISNIAGSSSKSIKIRGKVRSLDVSFKQTLSFNVKSPRFQKSFKKEFVFGNAVKSNLQKRIEIAQQADNMYMLQKRRGLYVDRLKAVDDRHKDGSNTNFYYTKVNQQTKQKVLVLLSIKNGKTESYEYPLPDKVSSAFFNFRSVDLNYDGQKDFFLGLLIEYNEDEKAQGAKDFIQFHYLDAQLKPLYNKHIAEFRPQISAITGFRNINLYPYRRKDGSEMALPVYIWNGGIHGWNANDPANDLPLKPWLKKKEPIRKPRLYYTELDESNMVLVERVINTYDFEQKFRSPSPQALPGSFTRRSSGSSTRYFENIIPLALGEQNKDLFYRGENIVYFSVGFAALQKTYEVTLRGSKTVMIRPIQFQGDANITRSMLSQQKDPNAESKNFFNTYLENGYVEFFDPQSKLIQTFNFRGQDFRGLKGTFVTDHSTHLLFEFGDHFKLFDVNNNQKYNQYPLGRVSFINGLVFKELTQKINVHNPAGYEGALYVDSSAITRGNVFALKYQSGKLIGSIRNNVYLKPSCVPMAPINLENRTYFTSICEEVGARENPNRVMGKVYLELNPIF